MDDIRIEWSESGAVRRVVLARPHKRNAITPAMFDTLIEIFESDPAAAERVVVISAEGPSFCAGVDLSERIRNGWPQESPLVRVCEAMRRYPVPIVAAVQGDAIAGGTMLSLHCDLIVAAHGAQLAMPLAQLGIAPPWILTARILARTGPALGREMLLVGDPVPVERLARENAINQVVRRQELASTVDQLAQRLAGNAPLSIRAVKAALSRLEEAAVESPHEHEDSLVRLALDSEDSREGMRARLEHRTPQFQGR